MQRLRFTPHFHQAFAHHRVFQAVGAVKIPGSSWHRAGSREVHGLADPDGYADSQSAGFPGDQTVLT